MRIIKYNTLMESDSKLPYLVKEKSVNYHNEKFDKITMPKNAVKMLNDIYNLSNQTEEYVYELCLSTRGHLIGLFEISHGNIRGSLCNTREIFMKALLCNASSIILVHNHPSGDCTPSKEDSVIKEQIKAAGKIMNMELLDFIIIGDDYYSFKENSRM